MTPEEYMGQRETLARQFRRCQNKDDRDRLQSKSESGADRDMTSAPCPRILECSYRDKSEKCLHDRGGDCYKWYVNAGRQQNEVAE